jgi:glycosyltransferase involved in cell wall biosynthesis
MNDSQTQLISSSKYANITLPSISIITATYNAAKYLPRLIESLTNQTDKDFEWIVADGGSTDETLACIQLASMQLTRVRVISQADCGIYYAFNNAIRSIDSDYYLVAGADDIFYSNAIKDYKTAIQLTGAELVSAGVLIEGRLVRYRTPKWVSLYGASALVSSHSVGLAIKRSIHDCVGLYDTRYRIYSDSHFILKAIKTGNANVVHADFIAGEFSIGGLSNSNHLESYCEQFMAQVELGASPFVQAMFLGARIYKQKIIKMLARHPSYSTSQRDTLS